MMATMQYRPLGPTGLRVSAVAFGAGPVPALLTDPDQTGRQRAALEQALAAGVNWFDTAATYGAGRSESAHGAGLRALGAVGRVHVATKVRLDPERLGDIPGQVRESVAGSLRRLGLERVTLLQLHNAITRERGTLPTSVTPADVLGPGGVREAFEDLRREGLVEHVGITAIGDADALAEVIRAGGFATAQVPYNLLTVSRSPGGGIDDGPIVRACAAAGVGVIAIRVLAGGALALRPPSTYTHTTKFFPLAVYDADRRRADRLAARLPAGMTLAEAAVRFAIGRSVVATALIGFADVGEVTDAARWAAAGPLSAELVNRLAEVP
jgi:aryl-alcohol dehydrogenase-like predicted oxidoreductase